MTEVRLDPQPGAGPRRAAAGRRLRARSPRAPDPRPARERGAGDPGPRLKVGAVRTRRLAASEAAARPSGRACGNPLRGARESAPTVPVGAPLVAGTDVPDAHGWRVYRAAPNSSGTASARCAMPSCRRSSPAPTGPDRRRGAGRARDGAGPAPKSAGDLVRIDGVTPRTRPRSARFSPRPETIANDLDRAYLQPTTNRTLKPDTLGNRPTMTG